MVADQRFERVDFNAMALEEEYYNCLFVGCNFTRDAALKTDFEKCRFQICNFTLTKFKRVLREVSFIDCKMTGADFAEVNRFSGGLLFENSQLDYGNFVMVRLPKTTFRNCKIKEASFDDATLTGSLFEHCDLERTSFARSNLERVDFSTAYNFALDPTTCRLKKTIFSAFGLRGLVAHLNIEIKE